MNKSSVSFNPHARRPTSIYSLVKSVLFNRDLIIQMTQREVLGRYKGSFMGLAWSLFTPIFMLVVYTYVFSEIFKSRWVESPEDAGKGQFALILFVGMIIFNLFSDVMSRAPGLIVSNVNFVKKVVFPIEILPIISLLATLFHSLISLCVLLIAFFLFNGYLNWTIIFLPLIILPLMLISLGFSWGLASLGVFLRDVSQFIGVVMTVMMFMSPVLYPVKAVPENFRFVIMLNPLTFIIEQARDVVIWGKIPDFLGIFIYMLASTAIAWTGYAWFQKTRKGFSDVI